MFESLKKKFSRTSEKLEEELIEEAEKEDNLQEESGKRFSFFSFGRKKEEKKEEEDESNLIPETTEETEAESTEETKESDDGVKEEKKSRFWSRSKDESDDEEDVDESDKDADDTEDEPDVEEVDEPEEEVKEEKKSRFWSRSKDESDDEEDVDEPEEEVKGEKKSHFWSRSKDKSDDEDSEDKEKDDSSEEKKSHFWSRSKDKSDKEDISADGEATGGLFSFVREKTISEKHVEDILWELEMELLQGDVAMEVATEVVDSVKNDLVGKKIKRSNDITEYTFIALRNAVSDIIDIPGKSMTEMIEEKKAQGEPLVVMFVGINGTGKTTTIGKLANYYLKKGYTPVIAASDTFRAGAIEQVTYHADNVGVKIIKHKKGSDAKAQGKELVLIDTAGRMQTNVNLMDEMKKIKRVANPDLVIFVGDALTGNDATEQAIKFNDAIDIDGVILTKADADSKGGASLSIGYVIQKPIMFLGVGQGYDDIKEYDAEWMLDQLFSESEEAEVLEE